jgi:hypothetical protein
MDVVDPTPPLEAPLAKNVTSIKVHISEERYTQTTERISRGSHFSRRRQALRRTA